MSNKKQIVCTIRGKVQMVMFRDFVQRKARGLDLAGSVQNLENHTVKVVAQGNEENLEKLVVHLHKGPFLA
jgi:acylphosphatase